MPVSSKRSSYIYRSYRPEIARYSWSHCRRRSTTWSVRGNFTESRRSLNERPFLRDTSSIKAFLTPPHQAGRRLHSARPIQRRFRTRKCLIK